MRFDGFSSKLRPPFSYTHILSKDLQDDFILNVLFDPPCKTQFDCLSRQTSSSFIKTARFSALSLTEQTKRKRHFASVAFTFSFR